MSRQCRTRVRFIKDTHLPRFMMEAGRIWEKRTEKFTDKGFPCGGGFVEKDRYEVIKDRKHTYSKRVKVDTIYFVSSIGKDVDIDEATNAFYESKTGKQL